jgi:hypothetical protein
MYKRSRGGVISSAIYCFMESLMLGWRRPSIAAADDELMMR